MRVVPLVVTAVLLIGCASPGGEASVVGEERAPGPDVAATMEVKVDVEEVRLVLHVTNVGDSPLEFTFPTSQRHDFAILTEAGERVWRWSDDRAFAQVVTPATLAPDETWTFESEWQRGGRAGMYEARGWLATRPVRVEQRMMLELP